VPYYAYIFRLETESKFFCIFFFFWYKKGAIFRLKSILIIFKRPFKRFIDLLDLGGKMKDSLKPGIEYTHRFIVPPNKTVMSLYPEAEEFNLMPNVFATGFLVGFIEWACIKALNPHLNWPVEQTVGIGININHLAATPPGLEVTAKVKLIQVEGRRLLFDVEVHDEIDLISQGKHERVIINKEKFDSKVNEKIKSTY